MAGSMTDEDWEFAEGSNDWESAMSSSDKEGAMKSDDDRVDFLEVLSKQEISKIEENIYRSNEEHLKAMTEMVDQKLEQQLAKDQAAQLKAKELLQAVQIKYSDEINKLKESVEKAKKDTEEVRKLSGSGLHAYQDEISKIEKNIDMLKKEQLQAITEMVEQRRKETTLWLEKQLADQRVMNSKSYQLLQAALTQSGSEIYKIKEILERDGEEIQEVCKEISKMKENVDESKKEQGIITTEVYKLKIAARQNEQQLKEQAAQIKSSDEINKLVESVEKAKKDTEEVRKLTENGMCMTQDELSKLEDKFDASKRELAEMVEQSRNEATLWLEKQLAEERATSLQANQLLEAALTKYDNEIFKINRILEKDREEVRKLAECGVHANQEEISKIQENVKAITEVHEKLKDATLQLIEEFAEYKDAQLKAEKLLEVILKNSTAEISKLKESLTEEQTKSNAEISELKLSLEKAEENTEKARELAESALFAYRVVQYFEQQVTEEQTKSNAEISELKLSLEEAGKNIQKVQELAENGLSCNGVTAKVVKQWTEEQFKILKEEELGHEAQYNEIRNLKGSLERAEKKTEEVRKLAESGLQAYQEEMGKIEDSIYSSISEMVERKVKEAMLPLEQKLKEEQAARLKLEELLQETQAKSSDEITKLRESLEKAEKERQEKRLAELQRKTTSILKEYFSARLLDEALHCVEELKAPEYHPRFVKETFVIGLEESPHMVEPVATLLEYLFINRVLTATDISTGCQLYAAMLDDIIIDAPEAPSNFGEVMGKLVLVGCLDCKRLKGVLKNVQDPISQTILEGTETSISTSPSGEAILAAESGTAKELSPAPTATRSPERPSRKNTREVVSYSTVEDASDIYHWFGRVPSLLFARRPQPHRCMLASTFMF